MTLLKLFLVLLIWEIGKVGGQWLYQKLFYKTVKVQLNEKSSFTITVRRGSGVDPDELAAKFRTAIADGGELL